MFNRTKCPRCNNKFSKKYNFCPNCGLSMRDGEKFFEPSFNLGFPLNMMFNSLTKQLEKQIEKEMKEMEKHSEKSLLDSNDPTPFLNGMTIRIDASNGNPVIKVSSMENNDKVPKSAVGFSNMITEEKAQKLSTLPKEEAQTNVRRLTDRLVYELALPGVEKDNVIISRLQNSIEIKAFSKDKAYFKLIPVSLPILGSKLEDGKLILELKQR